MSAPPPAVVPTANRQSHRLGVVAFVVGVVVFVGSVVVSSVIGGILRAPANYNPPAETLPFANITDAQAGTVGYLFEAVLVLGTLLGLWAVIQGLVAAISARGRRWGIVALVLGIAAPGLSFVAFLVFSA